MRKLWLKLLLFLLLLILPITGGLVAVEAVPDQYGNTYLAALRDKLALLEGTERKKMVFIGGSSLPFGLRSDLVEGEFDGEYEVVNFGLYATLGTKLMMDLALPEVGEGDIVVLSPELAAQTYSLYFNPQATLEALDGFSAVQLRLSAGENLKQFYHYYKFAKNKIAYARSAAPDPVGIYRRDSFNAYGDIAIVREENVMNNGVDVNTEISLTEDLLDGEFISYVNDFIKKAEKKGATVFFNYSPVNVRAVRSSRAQCAVFDRALAAAVDCAVLGTAESALIDERYFYDTNYHLNSAGAVYYTDLLVKNMKTALGREAETDISVPAPPALPEIDLPVVDPDNTEKVPFAAYDGSPNNDYVDCFEYRLVGGSYTVVGVKSEYLDMTEVILPSSYEGRAITSVSADAFSGCIRLERVRIGRTYRSIEYGAFNSCISLVGIYFYEIDGNRILPPSEGLLSGCNRAVKLYILPEANYMQGYTWSNYAEYFETFTVEGEE